MVQHYYNNHSRISGGVEQYNGFGTGWKNVVEKVVLKDHTFFRVEGAQYE